jgi:RHS repeat-associated protein
MFGYTGRYFDTDTGLQYNGERWYNPKLGQWLNQDPIGFAGDPSNLYRYVGNSPTNATDPSGEFALVAGGIAGLIYFFWPNPANAPRPGDGVCPANPHGGLVPAAVAGAGVGGVVSLAKALSEARRVVPNPSNILMPGGSLIGTQGTTPGIQVAQGGLPEAQRLFDELTQGATSCTPQSYPGTGYNLPGGGWVGLRLGSKSGGPAIDINNIPGVPITRIHFP